MINVSIILQELRDRGIKVTIGTSGSNNWKYYATLPNGTYEQKEGFTSHESAAMAAMDTYKAG